MHSMINTLKCKKQFCDIQTVKHISAAVSFGQMMPAGAMRRAEDETLACDLFIVLGSSLTVYPAAGFPLMAHRNGSGLAIVNQQPTDMDTLANVVIQAGIGATMQALME